MKTLALVMMVKNEEKIIERVLSSCKNIIDKIIICDTGSTDSTIEKIKTFAEINHINYEIHYREWKNFGWNRTETMKVAKGKADYLLLIDADEGLVPSPEFNKEELIADAYYVQMLGNLDYSHLRIVKSKLDWVYLGVTHEYISCSKAKSYKKINTLGIVDFSDGNNRKGKTERDIKLLKQGIIDEPNNARYYFYLGQSYADIGDYKTAIEYYLKRIEFSGWSEEVFYSKYKIGKCYEHLGNKDEAKKYYLAAWEYKPSRAESLYHLAELCRNNKEYSQGYLYATKGLEIPYPSKDILFIEKAIYDYLLLFEKSINAYYIGNYQEAYDDCKKLMTMQVPEAIKTQNRLNIQFSESKLFGKILTSSFDKESAYKALEDFSKSLREVNIPFFLMAGTLLGFVRENDFLNHDTDIDIGIFGDKDIEKIKEQLLKNGFIFACSMGEKGENLEYRFFKYGIQIDIFIFYKRENKLYCGVFDNYGNKYQIIFNEFDIISVYFRNIKVGIPEIPENYLITQYGWDWRTPKTNWDYIKNTKNIEPLK